MLRSIRKQLPLVIFVHFRLMEKALIFLITYGIYNFAIILLLGIPNTIPNTVSLFSGRRKWIFGGKGTRISTRHSQSSSFQSVACFFLDLLPRISKTTDSYWQFQLRLADTEHILRPVGRCRREENTWGNKESEGMWPEVLLKAMGAVTGIGMRPIPVRKIGRKFSF